MTSAQSESSNQFFEELSKVTEASQFVQGVQENPELVFNAIKGLTHKLEELEAATSIIRAAQMELTEKNAELLRATTELESAQGKIKRLEKKVSQSTTQSQTDTALNKLIEVLSQKQPPSVRTVDVNGVSIFTGDKQKFATWKESIFLKLKSNPDHFPTETSKMSFVYSKMSEECQAHLQSWISEGKLKFRSLKSMFELLGVLFDDPNRVRDAKVRLHSNKQRNKPFSTWIAEVRRDAAISGYDKHPEPLRDIIFLNLSLELKKALIHEKDLEELSLDQAIARLQDIENKQRSFASSIAQLNPRGPFLPNNPPVNHPNVSLTTTQGGDAMDLPQRNFSLVAR